MADGTFLAGISSRRSIGAAADLGGLGDGVCAACGGEAGAPADEAQQARAYVAWLCRHALNLHTEWPCTLPVTARTPCAYPCAPTAHRRAWHGARAARCGIARPLGRRGVRVYSR